MDAEFGESTTTRPQESQSLNTGTNDAGSFECNICFDLAQDPIVTLCGHLFCWPCLYEWLHIHANSQECPVCKAAVEEQKLIPLYGRGSTPSDPRSRSLSGREIPHRPAGNRPESSPSHTHGGFHHHHHHNHHHHQNRYQHQPGFGLMGGFPRIQPIAAARWGNFSLTGGIGGLFPSLFNFRLHGFPNAPPYRPGGGYPYGYQNGFVGGHFHHGFPHRHVRGQQMDSHLTLLFIIVGVLLVLALMGL